MRDIKFRAWDKKEKKLFEIFNSLKQKDWFLPNWKDNFKVMQYVGMKDINGKDIYEGDVCKIFSTSVYLNEYITLDEDWELITIIEENDYSYMFKDIEDKYNTIFLSELYDNEIIVEVIGNIYENPELLEVQE